MPLVNLKTEMGCFSARKQTMPQSAASSAFANLTLQDRPQRVQEQLRSERFLKELRLICQGFFCFGKRALKAFDACRFKKSKIKAEEGVKDRVDR